ncbi:DUF6381 family protein [Streptomyces sp. NPDC052494]|uniref:DUF6381 family protein n=1 Tax=Streptomyces sp. NPDC052494 TaxID=3365692 RepID=UPI0037CFF938
MGHVQSLRRAPHRRPYGHPREREAEQATDPQERQLKDKARRLKQQSDRESSEDIDPM